MEKTLVFGHKNPDTDTICSAIAYAALKKELGWDAEPVRLGDVSG
jgi:manganese-dependent inorganic pyrophosphatase